MMSERLVDKRGRRCQAGRLLAKRRSMRPIYERSLEEEAEENETMMKKAEEWASIVLMQRLKLDNTISSGSDEEEKISERRKRGAWKKFTSSSSPAHRNATSRQTSAPQSMHINLLQLMSPLILFGCFLVLLGASSEVSSTTTSLVAPVAELSSAQETDRQLQLLKSANVELSRARGQRLQRDATSGADQAPPTCGYPGSPAHASVTFNSSHVVAGTAASYTCDNGYELLGPPRRICQANGTWSPIGIPFCVLNVGLGKAAMQSSTAGHGSAQKAVDGSTSPYFQASTCTMTDVEHNPWWYVNLLEPYLVQIVRIDFGTACCANRQKATIAVRVGNNRPDLGNNPLCNRYHGFIEEGKPLFLPCTRPAPGAFVSIHLESPTGTSLSICETFIYTDHALSIEQCPSFRDQPLGSTATYNGKCYLFHNNQALNFDGARKYCESRGGTLVDETSPALQGFLSWELYRRHRNDQLMGQYWLGAVKDTRNPQNWKWINGKDLQISFWNSLTSSGNCSRFDGSKGWLWSDTDCSTNLNFICQYRPLSCGKPEKPTNSTLLTKNIDNGTVIEYQCAPGNLLMGPKSRTCLPTGFFSEFAPKCKYLDCQFPAMIQNGDYKLLNSSTSYQSVVNYFCNEGYQIYGKATLTCDVDERWNGPPPRCEPLLCPAPVPALNGYVTVSSNVTVPGTQATFDCRPGYELVGDRLLSCLDSGSWDNSFPYCREKARNPAAAMSTAILPAATPPSASTTPKPKSSSRQQAGSVQFPPAGSTFASSRLSPTSPSSPPPPPPSSTVSLNGIAAQFGLNPAPQVDSQAEQNRKASQPSNLNQFVVAPPPPPPQQPVEPSSSQAPQQVASSSTPSTPRFRPSTQSSAATQASASSIGRQQQQASSTPASNKFSGVQHEPSPTTNSISHLTTLAANAHQSGGLSSAPSSTSTTTMASTINGHSGAATPNVLSSFGAPIRAHNSLASAKYSLDGIIAVAIFGGFIFLGAIITIIVIIIRRRKSSHSSVIDAQTISTFDSNGGEHNGLYRNYQQAWENLRFAAPGAQPKSSGGVGLMGGPAVGLKSLSSANNVAMIHQMHQMHGHHNMAMNGSTSSSQSSSIGATGVSAMGGDPLLRNHPNGHHHHHHHHHLQRRSAHLAAEAAHHLHHHHQEDEESDGEQGVLSSDEANYRANQQASGEGFRDSNELTINAETVINSSAELNPLVGGSQQAARRRIYSTNGSIGRSMANAHRVSGNLSLAGDHHHHAPHLHHHHHHHIPNSNASSQHQRLVSSATPSTSTRSSRASPPSDDHSLEQLAYGNSWHQTNATNGNSSGALQQDSSNNSAGSAASILGANQRPRYN